MLRRHPELAVVAGAVALWIVFAVAAGRPFVSVAGTAAILNAAAPLGLLAVAVALLMAGGEFDLSVGSVVGAASMVLVLLSTVAGWNVWAATVAAVLVALAVGLGNGLLVVTTGLPSFIVTLATLFIVRGATIAGTRAVTGRTQLGGLEQAPGYDAAHVLFGGSICPLRVSVVWWLAATLAGAWLLARTRAGNWMLATGGAPAAARAMGVPVRRVKVALFTLTALAAALVAVLQTVRFAGADVLRGEQQEFRAIIAAVIGGTLLTGGYGSVFGASVGALVFGMVQQGIVMTGIDADWFQVFLGGMLLAAVLVNRAVRRRLLGGAA